MRAITSGGTPATLQSSACCSTPACFTPIISPESQSLDNFSKSFQEPLSFQCSRGISILVPSQFLESCHSLPFRHPSALLHFMHLRSNRQRRVSFESAVVHNSHKRTSCRRHLQVDHPADTAGNNPVAVFGPRPVFVSDVDTHTVGSRIDRRRF